MNRLSKISIVLSLILILSSCSSSIDDDTIEVLQTESTTTSTTTTEVVTTTEAKSVIGTSNIESKVLDLTPYIESKTKRDIYDNPSLYMEDVDFYNTTSYFLKELLINMM